MGRGADRVHKCDPGRPYVYWQLPPVEERQNQSNRPTVRGGPVRSVGHPTQSLTTAHEHGIYPNRRFAMCLVTHPEGLPTVTRPGRVANTPYQKPYPSAGGVCSRLPNIDPPLRHRASPAQTRDLENFWRHSKGLRLFGDRSIHALRPNPQYNGRHR